MLVQEQRKTREWNDKLLVGFRIALNHRGRVIERKNIQIEILKQGNAWLKGKLLSLPG